MAIRIKAIKFNHLPGSMNTDALEIRKNKLTAISVPEWVDGISTLAQDSLVAYAMRETQGNTITIQARFESTDTSNFSVTIRAIDPVTNPPEPHGCIAWLLWFLRKIFIALFGNVLGEVKARTVNFVNGQSNYETFELLHPRFWNTGVGVYFTEWQWQHRTRKEHARKKWFNMQRTNHKVYILLEAPTSPWNQVAGSNQLPWTEALEYGCTWAKGAKTRDEAATKITESIYNLGPSRIEYDCPGGGSSHYSAGSFNCTKFLERLSGGLGNGKYVNCSDCATIVSSFANLIGCDLWQSRMGGFYFQLNNIRGIGSSVWTTACNNWGGFSYHEVAWKGNCTEQDQIFDGCLQVDGDSDPMTAPHTPLLPTNMVFGDCTTMNYRLRLTPNTPAGCGSCNAQPSTRVRRVII
ncbi:MAG TPA: hypothetical protein VIU12_22305 [Chryseolinea sp.]